MNSDTETTLAFIAFSSVDTSRDSTYTRFRSMSDSIRYLKRKKTFTVQPKYLFTRIFILHLTKICGLLRINSKISDSHFVTIRICFFCCLLEKDKFSHPNRKEEIGNKSYPGRKNARLENCRSDLFINFYQLHFYCIRIYESQKSVSLESEIPPQKELFL